MGGPGSVSSSQQLLRPSLIATYLRERPLIGVPCVHYCGVGTARDSGPLTGTDCAVRVCVCVCGVCVVYCVWCVCGVCVVYCVWCVCCVLCVLSFISWQHLRAYQDRYQLVTVCTHHDFIVLPQWETRPPAP